MRRRVTKPERSTSDLGLWAKHTPHSEEIGLGAAAGGSGIEESFTSHAVDSRTAFGVDGADASSESGSESGYESDMGTPTESMAIHRMNAIKGCPKQSVKKRVHGLELIRGGSDVEDSSESDATPSPAVLGDGVVVNSRQELPHLAIPGTIYHLVRCALCMCLTVFVLE
jgi:type IV secretory pathway TrbL component